MTPNGRQDLAAVMAEMQEVGDRLAYQGEDGLAIRVVRWADRLAILLAFVLDVQAENVALRDNNQAVKALFDARAARLALLLAEAHPQVKENQEVARVDPMGDSKDNPTAAPDVAEGERSTTPDQKRNEWLLDDDGGLDDVVVDEPATFRLERMAPDHVWGAVYHRDGSRTTFDIYGDRKDTPLALDYEHEPAPNNTSGGGHGQDADSAGSGAPRTVNGEARDNVSSSSSTTCLPSPTPQAWRAIASAPTDGTRVVLFGTLWNDPAQRPMACVSWYCLARSDSPAHALGWFFAAPGYANGFNPTAWMPLPAAPLARAPQEPE